MARTVLVDYLSGYLVDEDGRQALFELPAHGGADCAVRTTTPRALGGWNPETVTEDTDLTLRILMAGQRVRYDVSATDVEEAVVSAQRSWEQRYRCARGHRMCLRDHRRPLTRSPHLSLLEEVETTDPPDRAGAGRHLSRPRERARPRRQPPGPLAALAAHASQVAGSAVVEPDAIVASARHWGAQARTGDAEAFQPTRVVLDLSPAHGQAPGAVPAAWSLVPSFAAHSSSSSAGLR